MKTEKQLQTRYIILESLADLPTEIQTLMVEIIAARHNTYAPYSKFRVRTAVLVGNSKVFTGSNQENATLPSGLCAERVSTYQASTQRPDEIVKMTAISGTTEDPTGQPASPCGACRQSLLEYETKQRQSIPAYSMGAKSSIIRTESIKDLLPLLFDGSLLWRRKMSANSLAVLRLSFAHPSVVVWTSGMSRTSETSETGGISETSETSGTDETSGTSGTSETSGTGGIKVIKRVLHY